MKHYASGLTSFSLALVPALAGWLCSSSLAAAEGTAPAAQTQLDALAEELRLANQDRAALATYHHDVGMRALQSGDLTNAIRSLTLAVDYSDGNNQQFQQDLERASALAGKSRDPRNVHIDSIVNAKLVEEQRLWVEVQERIESGLAHLSAERYNQAHQAFSMALVRLESLSYTDERREAEMRRVQQLISDSEARRQAAERQRSSADLADASQRQQELRAYELKLERQRIDAMLDRAQKARERRDYDEAILSCEQVLRINGAEERAHDLLVRCRRERHAYVRQMTAATWDEQHKLLSEEIRKNMLPQFEIVNYSEDWAEIDRIRSAPTRGNAAENEAWRKDIQQQLQQQLTLEFVDAEISDVVQFLQQNTGVNIVLDPQVVASGTVPPVTMQVANIRMANALEFIMTLTGLRYVLRDEAIYISSSEGVRGDVAMKIYDIADLTHPLTDFPGPTMRIPDPGGETGQLVAEIVPEDSGQTVDFFIDLVRNVVAPTTWDSMEGVSVDEHNGQMVVNHTLDVHKQIEDLLHTLRNQRGIQINVSTKWLSVEDGMLERIGMSLLGYTSSLGNPPIGVPPQDPARAGANGSPPGLYRNNLDDFTTVTNNQLAGPNRSVIQEGWYDTTFFGSNALQGGANLQYQMWEDPNGLLSSGILQAMEQNRKANIAIEPSITLFNGQRAHIVDLVQEAYVADYDVNGGQYDPVVSIISYGTVLDVRAIASADRKYITLTMRPASSRLINDPMDRFVIDAPTLSILFQVSYPIQVPRLQFESVETTVTIPDGGSILLAGLSSAFSGRSHSGIPFLSHIPFLGRLFSTNARSESSTKSIISVKANIVLFDEIEAKL